MTSPASLFANSIVPFSPAIGPSTLLPCHDQTTFQLSTASSTPGIDVVGGSTSAGGAAAAVSAFPAPGTANGCGGFLHCESIVLYLAFCHACWLVPRSNVPDGPSFRASLYPLARTSQLLFVQRSHLSPTNIAAAFLSFLNCQSSQFDATFAYSPPPG